MSNVDYSLVYGKTPLKQVRKASSRNPLAEKAFRDMRTVENKAAALRVFKAMWKNYTPEPFYTPGSYKTRRGYELLRGRESLVPSDNCGPVGRLRVIAGAPLERTFISFKDLPNVEAFLSNPDAQFSQQVIDWVTQDLEKIIKGPFVAGLERGLNKGNHVHVFHQKGACSVGTSELVSDEKLPEKAGYIAKKPYWSDENALAYLAGAELNNGRVPKRLITRRLGDFRTRVITVRDVENVTGLDLFK
jgi:hypothetical protein